jgi:hypothetical protein
VKIVRLSAIRLSPGFWQYIGFCGAQKFSTFYSYIKLIFHFNSNHSEESDGRWKAPAGFQRREEKTASRCGMGNEFSLERFRSTICNNIG